MRANTQLSILTLILITISVAQVPRTMNYQGKLTDSSGVAITGAHAIEFRLFDSETGGTALWSETHASVAVSHGLFDAILGSTTPIDLPFDEQYWVELVVDGETMAPRQPLTSVPYANRSTFADTAVYVEGIGSGGGTSLDWLFTPEAVRPVTLDNLTTAWPVPAGSVFVMLNAHSPGNNYIAIDGKTVIDGYMNWRNSASGRFLGHFEQPIFADEGELITAEDNAVVINGYLREKENIRPVTLTNLTTPWAVPTDSIFVITAIHHASTYDFMIDGKVMGKGYMNWRNDMQQEISSLSCPFYVMEGQEISNTNNSAVVNGYLRPKSSLGGGAGGADNDWEVTAGDDIVTGHGGDYPAGNVGIGTTTPDATALLELSSSSKGFLPPRMTEAQRDAISTPANALIIFNTTNECLQIYNHSEWNNIWCYSCAPDITMHPSNLSLCEGLDADFYVSAEGADLTYQWQENDGTGFLNLADVGVYSNVTTDHMTISPVSITMDTYQYRCIVGGSCSPADTSAIATLTVYEESTAPTSIETNDTLICDGDSALLKVNGGSLGTGAEWVWYSGSCGGTYVDTGDSILVIPAVTTTYYVRAEGTCNNTSCASITVEVTSFMPIGVQYYTTPDTFIFTVPDGITSISVAAVGGGGGGCGHLGGMGGDPDAVPGEDGGNSSFSSYITAYGGAGGSYQYDPAALGGGYSGPNGFNGGDGGTLYGGGGGGAATFTADGGNGQDGTPGTATYGGDGGDSGGAGRDADEDYGCGGCGGGIYLTGTPNTGEDGQYGVGGDYGGGGGGSSVNAGGGGGGGGAGLAWQNYIAVAPGDTFTVIVGEGGTHGASYAADGQHGAVRIIWEYPCSPEANYPDNAE